MASSSPVTATDPSPAAAAPPTAPAAPPSSWADKVRVSSSSNRFALKYVSHNLVGEIPRVSVPKEIVGSSSSKWDRCLVGYFPGSAMPLHAVRTITKRVWGHLGLQQTIAADGFFLFRFASEEGLHEVLQSGPWMLGGKALILQQWNPSFTFNKNNIRKVPVWVKLHSLPLPLWSEEGLGFVASIVGRPIACDKATHEGTRLAYARVCIELDAAVPPIHSFDLDSNLSESPIRVQVEYEWKPRRCSVCQVFGHNCEAVAAKDARKMDNQAPKGKEVERCSSLGSKSAEEAPSMSTNNQSNEAADRAGVTQMDLVKVPRNKSSTLNHATEETEGHMAMPCTVTSREEGIQKTLGSAITTKDFNPGRIDNTTPAHGEQNETSNLALIPLQEDSTEGLPLAEMAPHLVQAEGDNPTPLGIIRGMQTCALNTEECLASTSTSPCQMGNPASPSLLSAASSSKVNPPSLLLVRGKAPKLKKGRKAR